MPQSAAEEMLISAFIVSFFMWKKHDITCTAN
jgi:hypothetical protein